ncbi:T9SS type A sorting domain-containing protein [Euzebyella saccharophila]|uniref:T9SS type A sorting domain-containing protein n=1 Tax=Euzebyella saccharophila TaxID=679664 RepID=A0ABV8JU52_9FLAO|nr:T9SS type A sorting domain-containing protein [Euzebyella saccharophila]
MLLKSTCFWVLALMTISCNIFAKDIYVAKNGDDTNDGSLENPYLTLNKAASVAVAGDVVFIREGTYEETLAPLHSGSAGQPIIFQSFPGERVIISAMEALSGFTQEGGAIYKKTIPFSSLGQQNFVTHQETALDFARWPNKTNTDPFALGSIRNTGGSGGEVVNDAFLLEASIPGIDWTGGAVWFYGDKPGSGWLAWKREITSSSAGRVNFDLTTNQNENWVRTFHAPADLGDFYLEGVKGALDYQNEWFFDETSSTLYVQLPNGTAPADGSVQMRRRLETINLKDKSYIEIRNIAVFGGTINMEDSSTWWGTNANSKTTNNILYGVTSLYGDHTQAITNSSRSNKANITLQGSNNRIEKCEIAFNSSAGLVVRGNNHQILDNYIHDFNFYGLYDGPLVVRGINNSLIKNNTVLRGGRDAIQYNGTNNEFAFNDVSQSNLVADDCALFYTVGAQYTTEIHHNWFHDTASSGKKYKAAGVYLDNDAAGFVVHHNVIWNTEWTNLQINWNGTDIDIFNNTLWNGSEVMGAWHKEGTAFSNVRVWNNLGKDDNWEPQSNKQNNLVVNASVFNDIKASDFYLKPGSNPIDQGREIAGITEGFSGDKPDVGAYEFGGAYWTAGISWNPKFGPSGIGCYGLPGEDCVKLDPNDTDGDGVKNEEDQCPDTPLGETVNTTGCVVFTLPADNFEIKSIGSSCATNKDGVIAFTSIETNTYFTASLKETNVSLNFTSETSFNDLSAGTYTVCITTDVDSSYEQCFTVVLEDPEQLSVNAEVNTVNDQLKLNMHGGQKYVVTHNSKIIETSDANLKIHLQSGENKVVVRTAKDCQGIYEETFMVLDDFMVYPNAFADKLTLGFSNRPEKNINVQIIAITGNVVHKSQTDLKRYQELDLGHLSAGVYFSVLTGGKFKKQTKIVKK